MPGETFHLQFAESLNPFDEGRIEQWQGAALIKVTRQERHTIRPNNANGLKRRQNTCHKMQRMNNFTLRGFLAAFGRLDTPIRANYKNLVDLPLSEHSYSGLV